VTETMQAFKRARGYHLRRHGGPMLGCSSEVCGNRVERLLAGAPAHTIAPYEQGGQLHPIRIKILAGTGNR
jgi:hypothetical protein